MIARFFSSFDRRNAPCFVPASPFYIPSRYKESREKCGSKRFLNPKNIFLPCRFRCRGCEVQFEMRNWKSDENLTRVQFDVFTYLSTMSLLLVCRLSAIKSMILCNSHQNIFLPSRFSYSFFLRTVFVTCFLTNLNFKFSH